ncbi:hypothetical protein [Neopusillimonas maritima]|uniref:Uncharacterized protein n=1 Tax=Neopusillimonas maritima TaxID=2026239 RepID=A0A3A1YX89_9BURK|nr:hypothetical protein [Neopusillimonas maritima]RIY41104.1 hypothetical protein CJP73_08120 [Neopusillimonas maritima]
MWSIFRKNKNIKDMTYDEIISGLERNFRRLSMSEKHLTHKGFLETIEQKNNLEQEIANRLGVERKYVWGLAIEASKLKKASGSSWEQALLGALITQQDTKIKSEETTKKVNQGIENRKSFFAQLDEGQRECLTTLNSVWKDLLNYNGGGRPMGMDLHYPDHLFYQAYEHLSSRFGENKVFISASQSYIPANHFFDEYGKLGFKKGDLIGYWEKPLILTYCIPLIYDQVKRQKLHNIVDSGQKSEDEATREYRRVNVIFRSNFESEILPEVEEQHVLPIELFDRVSSWLYSLNTMDKSKLLLEEFDRPLNAKILQRIKSGEI